MPKKIILARLVTFFTTLIIVLVQGCGADITTTAPFPEICIPIQASIYRPTWDCSPQPGEEGKVKNFRCVYPKANMSTSITSCMVECQNHRIIQNASPSPLGVSGEVTGSTMGDAGTLVKIICYPNAL